MIKQIIFLYLIIFNYTLASKIDLVSLQQEFHQKVIINNIYKKRFHNFLKQNCKDNDEQCYKKQIKRLQGWKTTKQDKSLQYLINKKKNLVNIDKKYWKKVQSKLNNKKGLFKNSQFISLIDISNQLYILTLYNNHSQKFHYIGSDLISSGDMQREAEVKKGEDHYLKTPNGVFKTQGGWRSDGKIINKDVLPYGKKNRYIFYFGKQNSIRYNTFDKNGNKIKDKTKWQLISDKLEFAIHAHESSKSLGQIYSHGCIRMTNELNLFLDNNLVLHKNMYKNKKWLHKYDLAPSNPKNFGYAGEYLIVFDKI